MQREITTPGPLLTLSGELAAPGFSRFPVLRYNPENIGLTPLACLNRLRLKEWDFYATTTRDFCFAVAVAHGGLAGVVFAHLCLFATRTLLESQRLTPLGRGVALPRTSEAGDVLFRGRGGVEVAFRREPERERRLLSVRWPRFDAAGATLTADLEVRQPRALESTIVATPIGAKGFYYNQKVNCMPTEGAIRLGGAGGGDERRFDLAGKRALTTLDWGRGVWPYRTFWQWATAQGYLPDGRTVGVNLGAGFGDLSAATENAFFIDGKMTKVEAVPFDYDACAWASAPWRFRSSDGKLDLTLTPGLFELSKTVNALVIRSEIHQATGTFAGTLVTDAGERIEVADVVGWAEEHRARW